MFQQSTESNEAWQRFMELRCHREVIERWLAICSLPDGMQPHLRVMLHEVDDQLQVLTEHLGMRGSGKL
jgi:hypothetical protein